MTRGAEFSRVPLRDSLSYLHTFITEASHNHQYAAFCKQHLQQNPFIQRTGVEGVQKSRKFWTKCATQGSRAEAYIPKEEDIPTIPKSRHTKTLCAFAPRGNEKEEPEEAAWLTEYECIKKTRQPAPCRMDRSQRKTTHLPRIDHLSQDEGTLNRLYHNTHHTRCEPISPLHIPTCIYTPSSAIHTT